MLLAGGQGSRLHALTSHVAKPAVPFGGKYRIIDFPLSNCINSGIDTVGVLTQYRPLELNAYIGNGEPGTWTGPTAASTSCPPTCGREKRAPGTKARPTPSTRTSTSWRPMIRNMYSSCPATTSTRWTTPTAPPPQGADAACTIAVLEVPMEEASRFGIMNVDENDDIYEFEEKPKHPKSNLASMGIYIFTWSKLREYLIADEADERSSNDFGKNIIPPCWTPAKR